MAKPASPVIAGLEQYEKVFKGGDGVHPLPSIISGGKDGIVTARWELTPEEREAIAKGADVFVSIWTFERGLPPQAVNILHKDMDPTAAKIHLGIHDEQPVELAPPPRPKATVTKFAKKKPGRVQ